RLRLGTISGLRYRYDSAAQTLEIDAADSRLVPQLLGYVASSETEPSSNVGVVLNYALSLQSENTNPAAYETRPLAPQIASGFHLMPVVGTSEFQRSVLKSSTVALDTDFRVFSPVGLFVDHGYTTHAPDDSADYVRYDTYWRRTSVDSLRTWVAGDF